MYGRSRGRFSRSLRLRPIDSTKNIIQFDGTVASTSVADIVLAQGVNPTDIDETNAAKTHYVMEGSSIRGINLSVRVYNKNADTVAAKSVIAIYYDEDGVIGLPSYAQMNSLGSWPVKSKIFHMQQASPPGDGGIPMVVGGFRIPRRFHKMKNGGKWHLLINNSSTGSINYCGFATYKWYK